jgi:Holliday junction resolvase RusA-like endonuclease
MTITFRVHGTPKGQPRPRACVRGNHAAVYDPKGTPASNWRDCVYLAACAVRPDAPINVRCRIRLVVLFARPANRMRKKDPLCRIPWIRKPDASNCLKLVEDAITDAGIWTDDCLADCLGIERYYVAIGESPGAEVFITTD